MYKNVKKSVWDSAFSRVLNSCTLQNKKKKQKKTKKKTKKKT